MDIDPAPFINAGVPGAILLWFMLRLERILNRFERTVQLMSRVVIRMLERRDPDMASGLSKAISRTDTEE